ncbi:MAG: 50S ribosomal protein L23 [Candidatus Harrisonbacteria bacterium RIFCSPLOWO2_02_FULL_41_11]|uniref:Large ribosomal subunit protein uL23 n=1 Tax=Candidatus Harrisonbacteria bacterium RIFCSPHIGHO2_02_FULL_42_16 TaxID=1798404 RepID=A0A1G1ZK13_9BACT|nr:MAG: 50S ribosomal protein L23 [Candidatus Harrisonbacteria bacterium RIFCSPHIGHO2_02_FULL_42_16]OGY67641.1 MAG: 50S ribosomal protein L23 [Candidatus Harrisonbacteria bacterium RIFCSPLOWO2_02_FULL_41_11]
MDKFLVKRPIITEKSTELGKLDKYIFLVENKASKSEAKKIVENTYNVKVISANVINAKSKKRRLGASLGIRPGYKKIIMTLQKGQKLDIIPQ